MKEDGDRATADEFVMTRYANARRDAEILAGRKSGLPLRAIAAEFGVSRARIQQVIRSQRGSDRQLLFTIKCVVCGRSFETFNTSAKKGSNDRSRRPGAKIIAPEKVLLLWKRGRSIDEIASFFAMPIAVIQETLDAELGKRTEIVAANRRQYTKGDPLRDEVIIAKRKEGLTMRAIADEFGICGERVRQIIGSLRGVGVRGERLAEWRAKRERRDAEILAKRKERERVRRAAQAIKKAAIMEERAKLREPAIKRNALIFAMRNAGMTIEAIGADPEVRLTKARVSQILLQEDREG